MKKKSIISVIALSLIMMAGAIQLVRAESSADDNKIRIYLKDRGTVVLNESDVDSITTATSNGKMMQRIWHDGSSTDYAMEDIDSIRFVKPTLSISSDEVDFGKVAVGSELTIPVQVTNTGKYAEVLRVKKEGTFESNLQGDVTIEPGQSVDLEITYAPSDDKTAEGMLKLESNAVNTGAVDIPLRGKGVYPVETPTETVAGYEEHNEWGDLVMQSNAYYVRKDLEDLFISYDEETGVMTFEDNELFDRLQLRAGDVLYSTTQTEQFPYGYCMKIAESPRRVARRVRGANSTPQVVKIVTEQTKLEDALKEYRNTPVSVQHIIDSKSPQFRETIMKSPDLLFIDADDDEEDAEFCLKYDREIEKDRKLKYEVTSDGFKIENGKHSLEFKQKTNLFTYKYKFFEDKKKGKSASLSVDLGAHMHNNVAFQVDYTQNYSKEKKMIIGDVDLTANLTFEYKHDDIIDWVNEVDSQYVEKLKKYLKTGKRFHPLSIPIVNMPSPTNMIIEPRFDLFVDFSLDAYGKLTAKCGFENTQVQVLYDERKSLEDRLTFSPVDNGFVCKLDGVMGAKATVGIAAGLAFHFPLLTYKSSTGSTEDSYLGAFFQAKDEAEVKIAGGVDFSNTVLDLSLGETEFAVSFEAKNKLSLDVIGRFAFGALGAEAEYTTKPFNLDKKEWEFKWETSSYDLDTLQNTKPTVDEKIPQAEEYEFSWESQLDDDDVKSYDIYVGRQSGPEVQKVEMKKVGTAKRVDGKVPTSFRYAPMESGRYYWKVVANTDLGLEIPTKTTGFYVDKIDKTKLYSLSATELDFEEVYVDQEVARSVVLTNNSDKKIAVRIIPPSAPFYIGEEYMPTYEVEAGKTLVVYVSYKPTGVSESASTMQIQIADGGEGLNYDVTLKGKGISTEHGSADTHEYVDLGLSVKWATCNVGANSPEEYGDYIPWGETSPKEDYSCSTYKWCNGTGDSMTKYCTDSKFGTVDNKTVLYLSDDAAHVNWGGSWRMPTKAELTELREKCTWTWTTQNGANGYKVTGPNGNSIFLPAAGSRWNTSLYRAGSDGNYWSSSLHTSRSCDAYHFSFDSNSVNLYYNYRYGGYSVRPVCQGGAFPQAACYFSTSSYTLYVCGTYTQTVMTNSDGAVTYTSSNPSVASVDASTGKVTGVSVGNATITATIAATGTYASTSVSYDISVVNREYVDLGLSVKWATCNVGANSPEKYGDYFAWGETSPNGYYFCYFWNTYKLCKWNGTDYSLTKYCTNSDHGTVDNKTTLDLSDDAAHVNWGASWRMPTKAEQDELREKCAWTWTTQNRVNGYKVTGPNGNSIFLPAAGFLYGETLGSAGSIGGYWSSSLSTWSSHYAYCLDFDSSSVDWSECYRFIGQSVRAVWP